MPRGDGLTLTSRRILGILRERGDWVTRAELASALQHCELSSHHLKLLKRMVDKRLIEVSRYRTPSKVLIYQYRAKS